MRTLTDAHWPADDSAPLHGVTVGELLMDAAADTPADPALISVGPGRDDRTWSFAELADDAAHAAAWLLERHEPGEHVAVWAPNVPEWVVLQYGAALAGLVLITANPALREDELVYALDNAEAAGLFCVAGFRGTDMAAVARRAADRVPGVGHVTDLGDWLDRVRRTPKRDELPAVDPYQATQIQFTSGTTGNPKPTLLRHMAMVTNAVHVRERCGAPPGSVYGTALPLFHTAGCGLAVMGSVAQRAPVVLAEVFDPATVLASIERHRVVAFGGVPLMLHALLAHPDNASTDLSSLQVMMSGGDLVPPALIDGWAERAGTAMSAVYGQTEASPIICQTSPGDAPDDNRFTAGLPLPRVEVSIRRPDDGTLAAVGEVGEVCARGYLVMMGYLGMPEATAETVDADGWLHTGDLGMMDSRGYVTVTGRLGDMIIRGGENIYPAEIEEVLGSHEAIVACLVIGVPDEAWGEQVAAVVQFAPDATRPTAAELHDLVREHLAPFKTPKEWFVIDEPPTNAMGKAQKFRLSELLAAGELPRLA